MSGLLTVILRQATQGHISKLCVCVCVDTTYKLPINLGS